MLIRKLGRNLGFGLIGLALAANLGARIAEHYQNKPRVVNLSEFYYYTQGLHDDKKNLENIYRDIEYASYALGISGAALALRGKRISINVNREENL